jgi:hypothetical protein
MSVHSQNTMSPFLLKFRYAEFTILEEVTVMGIIMTYIFFEQHMLYFQDTSQT